MDKNQEYKGIFIAVEGQDGTGKETQTKLLVEHLRASGLKVVTFDFPQYDTLWGGIIGKMLKGDYGPIENLAPLEASVPFAMDRLSAKSRIQAVLSGGAIAITNRYVDSNKAHQGARVPEKDLEWFLSSVDNAEYRINQIPRPDYTVFLDVPPEVSQELITKKVQRKYLGDAPMDILEKDIAMQMRAQEIYQRLAANDNSYLKITCCEDGKLLSPEIIHEKVWSRIEPLLSLPREGIIQGERQR